MDRGWAARQRIRSECAKDKPAMQWVYDACIQAIHTWGSSVCSWGNTCSHRRCCHPRHLRHQQRNSRTVATTEQQQSSNIIEKHNSCTRPSIFSFIPAIAIFTYSVSSTQSHRQPPRSPGLTHGGGEKLVCPVFVRRCRTGGRSKLGNSPWSCG